MRLTGLHLLLTYECNFECDHCFVWSSPRQSGTLTMAEIDDILGQAVDLGTIEWVYFEGGEPFLYHAVLNYGVRKARTLGFRVGIVSNGYWATTYMDAVEWLRDLAGLVDDLSVSSDLYHGDEEQRRHADNANRAAQSLGIPAGTISIAQPDAQNAASVVGKLPDGESRLMFRGRAAAALAPRAKMYPWKTFGECPYENLRDPGRMHVDPLGHVHICQGIALGNLFETPLGEIIAGYVPDQHPITGALLAGGPVELVHRYDVPHAEDYADACHLCDHARRALRARFPETLAPDQMYGGGATAAGARG